MPTWHHVPSPSLTGRNQDSPFCMRSEELLLEHVQIYKTCRNLLSTSGLFWFLFSVREVMLIWSTWMTCWNLEWLSFSLDLSESSRIQTKVFYMEGSISITRAARRTVTTLPIKAPISYNFSC